MDKKLLRCLLVLAATLIGAAGLIGCDDEAGWNHPNRQRYPAPPTEQDDSMSLEELQQSWKKRDRLADSNQKAQNSRVAESQAAVRESLGRAIENLGRALQAALEQAAEASPDNRQPAVGGGPLPEAHNQDDSPEM